MLKEESDPPDLSGTGSRFWSHPSLRSGSCKWFLSSIHLFKGV